MYAVRCTLLDGHITICSVFLVCLMKFPSINFLLVAQLSDDSSLKQLFVVGVPVIFDIEGCMLETLSLLTSGQLQARVSWGVDAYGNPLIPVVPASHNTG